MLTAAKAPIQKNVTSFVRMAVTKKASVCSFDAIAHVTQKDGMLKAAKAPKQCLCVTRAVALGTLLISTGRRPLAGWGTRVFDRRTLGFSPAAANY